MLEAPTVSMSTICSMAVLCSTAAHQRHLIQVITEQNTALAEQIASVSRAAAMLPKGLTPEQVGSLPRATSVADGSTCCICLEPHDDDGVHIMLPCGDQFDEPCIAKWLAVSPRCPLCNTHALSS